MTKKICQWFVFPTTEFTNSVLVGLCSPEDFIKVTRKSDDVVDKTTVGMWQCSHEVVGLLYKNPSRNHGFTVWVRHSNVGPVTQWTFEEMRKDFGEKSVTASHK